MFFTYRLSRFLAVGALIGGFVLAAQAQEETPAPSPHARAAARPDEPPPAVSPRRLPADSTTEHSLVLPGRTLDFKATAGTIKLTDEKGVEQADIAFVAYQLKSASPESRPVAFVFNGGPGAASVWLHLGALGPWRLPLEVGAISPSSAPVLVDNDDTWLDFTDLVFIDPAGTGYSQIVASTRFPPSCAAGLPPTSGWPRQNSLSAKATAAFVGPAWRRRWRPNKALG
jgi:carboxypeptidase C (cathepsin A)